MQVESTLIPLIFSPFNNNPESDASLKASSADSAIAGVSSSIGPVNPKIIPTFISAKTLVIKIEINNNTEVRILNIFFLLSIIYINEIKSYLRIFTISKLINFMKQYYRTDYNYSS